MTRIIQVNCLDPKSFWHSSSFFFSSKETEVMNYLQEYCLTFYALKLITCLCLYGRLNGVMFQKYGACMNSFILSCSRPNHALMPPPCLSLFPSERSTNSLFPLTTGPPWPGFPNPKSWLTERQFRPSWNIEVPFTSCSDASINHQPVYLWPHILFCHSLNSFHHLLNT